MNSPRAVKLQVSLLGERRIEAVRRIAREAQISERTARRYLEKGECPPGRDGRVIGRDGKRYPRGGRCGHSPLRHPLMIALSNIRRAAREPSFHDGDLAKLREIVTEANVLLAEWEECHDEFKTG